MKPKKIARKLKGLAVKHAAVLGLSQDGGFFAVEILSNLERLLTQLAKKNNTVTVGDSNAPRVAPKAEDFKLPVGYAISLINTEFWEDDSASYWRTRFLLKRRGHKIGDVSLLITNYNEEGKDGEEDVSFLHYASDLGGDGVSGGTGNDLQTAVEMLIDDHQEYIDRKRGKRG